MQLLTPAALTFAALLLLPEAAPAGGGRTSPPSDSGSPPTRVERSSPSYPSSTPSSPPSSGSSSSADSGSSRASTPSGTPSRAGRTRPPGADRPGGDRIRIDGRRPGHGHGGTSYHHHYYDPYYNPYRHYYIGYYGPYWWYWPWWDSYYSYGYYGRPRPYYYDNYYGDLGALDLDISPEKAEVHLDGQYIGVADDFDGFPAYLWLEEGAYDLVFYKQGYGTVARRYKIIPGVVIDVEDRLFAGESLPPQEALAQLAKDLGPLPREAEPRQAERRQRSPSRYDEPRGEGRVAERRVERRQGPAGAEPLDVRGEPGRLALRLSPEDASVYLDGRFLGTAGELAKLHAGLIIDPGSHRLEVVRPGYSSDSAEFDVEAGEEVTIELDLQNQEVGR